MRTYLSIVVVAISALPVNAAQPQTHPPANARQVSNPKLHPTGSTAARNAAPLPSAQAEKDGLEQALSRLNAVVERLASLLEPQKPAAGINSQTTSNSQKPGEVVSSPNTGAFGRLVIASTHSVGKFFNPPTTEKNGWQVPFAVSTVVVTDPAKRERALRVEIDIHDTHLANGADRPHLHCDMSLEETRALLGGLSSLRAQAIRMLNEPNEDTDVSFVTSTGARFGFHQRGDSQSYFISDGNRYEALPVEQMVQLEALLEKARDYLQGSGAG